ncbi:MAG TPA: VWA domain-containing protein [Thermoanaerobaculia bacterium]|nr:VWA domain-containing protein [Thermoanaerobaculia bacterium]
MRRVLLMFVLVGVMPAVGLGQRTEQAPVPQVQVFRSAVSMVALNVTVTDADGFVAGLQKEDFAIFEDGVQQPIHFFEARDVPIDLILLLDTSSSIRDRLSVVHTAAIGFMRTLRPGDRGAVVTFGDNVQVPQPLTSDRALLESAILSTRAYGGTSLYNALYIALRQFGRAAQDAGEMRRQAFVVLSDGEDTASLLAFDDVLTQARRSGVSVYTIHLLSGIEAPTARLARQQSDSEFAMRRLADDTGGLTFTATEAGMLSGIYAGIAEELASQYSMGYVPTDDDGDGRFRRISVRIADRPNLRPRARAGYLPSGRAVAGRR